MVNVGLRAFIWESKSVEEQLAREVRIKFCLRWKSGPKPPLFIVFRTADVEPKQCNLPCLSAICQVRRKSVPMPIYTLQTVTLQCAQELLHCSNCKENGFPEQQALHIQQRPSSASNGNIAASEVGADASNAGTSKLYQELCTSACTCSYAEAQQCTTQMHVAAPCNP